MSGEPVSTPAGSAGACAETPSGETREGVRLDEQAAGSGRRRVEPRVGQSRAFGDDGKLRRLRRGQTIAPTGQQEIDRPMSQGLFDCDDVDASAYAVGRGRFDASEATGGLATPLAGVSESEGEGDTELPRSRPYYAAPKRSRSLVEMPSSPARPPKSLSRRGTSRGASPVDAARARSVESPAAPGPELGRRRSSRIEARSQAAVASQGVGPPASTLPMPQARGRGRGRGRSRGAGAGV